jgi:hypothetical protein
MLAATDGIMTSKELKAGPIALCLCLCASLSSWGTVTGYQDWQFATDANPSVPTAATSVSELDSVTVEVGYLGSGWLASLGGFGTQTGLWDLGFQNPDDSVNDTRGWVLLNAALPISAGNNSSTDLGIRITQFVDGVLYKGDLTFSIPGVVHSGRSIVEALPGPLGGNWVEDEFHLSLAPSPEQISLTITGAVGGTLLDRIRVDATSTADLPQLLITSVAQDGQNLTVSWTGGLPPYQIYVASNLVDSVIWQPLGTPVSGTSASIPVDGPLGFIRIAGSN